MNYRHHFHAGNFADVFKHILLVSTLDSMQKKELPLTYFDTHAGRGLYLLSDPDTQKLKEYQFGIDALLSYQIKNPAPKPIESYLEIVKPLYLKENNTYYPGSPKIAESLMRSYDKMRLCELHPEEFILLRKNMQRKDRMISFLHMDAYAALKASLPLKITSRGLIMIDPPFEKKNEFTLLEDAIKESLKRWQHGNYMIWYPIKEKQAVTKFQNKIKNHANSTLFVNFSIKYKKISSNLTGCGVAFINPPWQLEAQLSSIVLPYLAQALGAVFEITT